MADGVVLTPTAKSGGANYLTMVQDGSLELALHHHVEGAQHGPYGGRPLPLAKIRASDNWRAACRELFHLAGLADPKATGGASIKLYGFDSNFPNRHVDYPEHFHVMLEWDNWQKNNVGPAFGICRAVRSRKLRRRLEGCRPRIGSRRYGARAL